MKRFDDPPEPPSEDVTITLEGGYLEMRWNRYDDEAEAFAKTVFRTLFKTAIDRFITVERKSRRALSARPWRNRRYGGAGRRAEAWALARRHNYFFAGRLKKPASYPFAPHEIFSPAELAKWRADEKTAFAAHLDWVKQQSRAAFEQAESRRRDE